MEADQGTRHWNSLMFSAPLKSGKHFTSAVQWKSREMTADELASRQRKAMSLSVTVVDDG